MIQDAWFGRGRAIESESAEGKREGSEVGKERAREGGEEEETRSQTR